MKPCISQVTTLMNPFEADPAAYRGGGWTAVELWLTKLESFVQAHSLAEARTELDIARAYIDRCVQELDAGQLTAEDAAMAKWWCTDLQGRVIDRCLQLHGGYGYMLEYPIARAYADARVTRIYGGSNEIMKEIIGRSLGL